MSVDVARRGLLVGVVHLPALPGSPNENLDMAEVAALAQRDAAILAEVGFDAIIVENFGDAPFFSGRVPAVTVAAMTACALAVKAAAPRTRLGINVLRNDALSAMAIAACTGAAFVRVNVLAGARVTDQGIVQGEAAELLRLRRSLGATGVEIWADVDVKHSAPLGAARPLVQEVEDLTKRAMASAVLVTGDGTGKGVDEAKLAAVKASAGDAPVLVASGARLGTLGALARASDGVIVGTALRPDDRAGIAIDRDRARAFADAFRRAYGEG